MHNVQMASDVQSSLERLEVLNEVPLLGIAQSELQEPAVMLNDGDQVENADMAMRVPPSARAASQRSALEAIVPPQAGAACASGRFPSDYGPIRSVHPVQLRTSHSDDGFLCESTSRSRSAGGVSSSCGSSPRFPVKALRRWRPPLGVTRRLLPPFWPESWPTEAVEVGAATRPSSECRASAWTRSASWRRAA